MGGFIWANSMSVGDPEMDADHRKFFKLLNLLDDALRSLDGEESSRLGKELLRHAEAHNQREFNLLKSRGYDNIALIEDAQHDTISKIRELNSLIDEAPLQAMLKIGEMQEAMIHYLFDGDVNYKEFLTLPRKVC